MGAHLVPGLSLLSWETRQTRLALRGTSMEPSASDLALGPRAAAAAAPGGPPAPP